MTQRQEIIERLSGMELGGGGHEMLSAICKAVLPHNDAWTLRRCADLRDELVRLLSVGGTGSGITDELREWVNGIMWARGDHKAAIRHDLLAIADRIDAEHEAQLSDAFETRNSDENLESDGWVRLPKDADGVPIRVGDVVVEHRNGYDNPPYRVECITLLSDDTWEIGGCGMVPRMLTHYHAPTVEDVLREFFVYAERGKEHHREDVDDAVLAVYAAKLRLAGGDAE